LPTGAHWKTWSLEKRRQKLAGTHAKTRFFLPTIASQGGNASAARFFSLPPEEQAFIVSRLVANGVRAAAIKRGLPPPILYEREARPDENGTLIVDTDKVQEAVTPDPALYRALPAGDYAYIPAPEQWEGDTAAIRRRARNARRRARRKTLREAREAADAAQAEPIDITPPKKPD
jgi:hypothetical protein